MKEEEKRRRKEGGEEEEERKRRGGGEEEEREKEGLGVGLPFIIVSMVTNSERCYYFHDQTLT